MNLATSTVYYLNKKNETALHIAANEGHIKVVHLLLRIDEYYKEKLMRMTDENGDTALHKAVQSRHQDVARMLVKEDPDFEFPSNKFRETPLYLEAESGLHEALIEILNSSKQPTSSANYARLLLQWNRSWCEEPDVGGWNLLHFAALLGLKEVVSDKLGWKISLAYLPAGSENDWTTTIHIAAGEAILYSQANVVNYLLKPTKWDKLIENPDNNGNTPLHLLASSNFWSYVPLELKDHPRAKKMSYKKENKTPFDIAMSCTEWTEDKDRIVPSLYHNFFISIAQLGRRSPRLNQMDRQKIIFNQPKECDTNIKAFQALAQAVTANVQANPAPAPQQQGGDSAAARIYDFMRMNQLEFYGSKSDEDPRFL
ncbi:hypothetical protein CQW23_13321 [Capsicum baccatum]|uniref:Uncharacterized protein n=1 Tax=Capsicum baccatum TaxID=33114 RepID=A0A2G2WV53_CAPBA|nr:hypothetical protein CQW23_13321 [Capsicum baccatum]